MIYPVESTESWSKKYKIEPITRNCPKCGEPIRLDIPFADGKLRGFVSKDCECGQQYMVTFVVDDKEFWNEVSRPTEEE